MENKIYLLEKVPIRTIQEPYCEKCMNVGESLDGHCNSCLEHPLHDEWYFNRCVAIGVYKTFKNEPYNNIPYNILSRMILRLKSNVKKNKSKIGSLLADGLYKRIKDFNFLIKDTSYLLVPPKSVSVDENQCKHFLKPLIEILRKDGYDIQDISDLIVKTKDIGKQKEKKTRLQRFVDIKGIHSVNISDLHKKKILILDDIVTTNSTTWDISRALKEKNAGDINILTIGRAYDPSSFPSDYEFDEMLIYFSNIDYILEKSIIDKVQIKNYQQSPNEISCNCSSYTINISLKDHEIIHNCPDFSRRRFKNIGFCKHLTKLFDYTRELEGIQIASTILKEIFDNLEIWDFKTS